MSDWVGRCGRRRQPLASVLFVSVSQDTLQAWEPDYIIEVGVGRLHNRRGVGRLTNEEGWRDYIIEEGWGDYIIEEGWGDYIIEEGRGDYIIEEGWGDKGGLLPLPHPHTCQARS